MTPLDLRTAPPRAPRLTAGGAIFLPRSIDKARAALPGGDLGEYTLEGITQMMLERFGLTIAEFTAAVAAAGGDDDVVAFVRERATQATIDEWNASIAQRLSRNGNRAEALVAHPWLHARPDLTLSLDVLEEDDRRSFAP
jgi:predicted trehalose synthase